MAGKSKSKAGKRTPKRARKKPAARRKAAEPRWRYVKDKYASLAELRQAIDEVDATIVPLLCLRLGLVRSAAQFKPSHDGVVVRSRVEQIIAQVRKVSGALGCNPDTLEAVYRTMIDEFTREEQRNWRLLNEAKA